MTTTQQPTTVRALDTPAAKALADLTSMLDDLHTVLYCCERLVSALDPATGAPDDLLLESVWTTALLSYGRCFTDAGRGMALTDEDVKATSLQGEVLAWHQVLRELRTHYASDVRNPRERFSVGAALDTDGAVTGIAITSARQPRLDEITVRQTGALAYELSTVVDRRLGEQQDRVLTAAKELSAKALAKLPVIDIASSTAAEDGPER
jgi:hypothetical protein